MTTLARRRSKAPTRTAQTADGRDDDGMAAGESEAGDAEGPDPADGQKDYDDTLVEESEAGDADGPDLMDGHRRTPPWSRRARPVTRTTQTSRTAKATMTPPWPRERARSMTRKARTSRRPKRR